MPSVWAWLRAFIREGIPGEKTPAGDPQMVFIGDMDVLGMLAEAVAAHGLNVVRHTNHVDIDHGRLSLTASIFEHSSTSEGCVVMLEIIATASLIGERPVIESFAGSGPTRGSAVSQALANFLVASFHVLIESLTTHECDSGQVEKVSWARSDTAWTVYDGPMIQQFSTAAVLGKNYPAFCTELTRLFLTVVPPGFHWVRIFVASFEGKILAFEALLDNEPWPAGVALLEAQSWDCVDEYQSVRHFMLALPAD